mgnify:CR=1 FL=1
MWMYKKGKGKASTYSICPELGEEVEFASPIVDVSPIESCLLCKGEEELPSVFLVGPLSLIDGLLKTEFREGISQKRTHRVSISSQQSHSLKMDIYKHPKRRIRGWGYMYIIYLRTLNSCRFADIPLQLSLTFGSNPIFSAKSNRKRFLFSLSFQCPISVLYMSCVPDEHCMKKNNKNDKAKIHTHFLHLYTISFFSTKFSSSSNWSRCKGRKRRMRKKEWKRN